MNPFLILGSSWAIAQLVVTPGQTEERLPGPEIETRSTTGEVLLTDGVDPVLRYVAGTLPLPDGYLKDVAEVNHIYAKPRSGYIHPLYGLDGTPLTLDWSTDHPHHRGIYWAWPEVQFDGELGDLHALQTVYSRPVGEPAVLRTAGFSRVAAQNLWLWQDETPVVFERVRITAYALGEVQVRAIDLDLSFEALTEGIRLARRETNLYGGLNVRLAPVDGLEFAHHADVEDAPVRRAWSTATGTWAGSESISTLAILEHPTNPDYPGDWVTYEYLPWFQPAFPSADTRFELKRGQPLRLRYRFLILLGPASEETLAAAWDGFAANEPLTPQSEPEKLER